MLPFLEAIHPELERVNDTVIKRLHSDEPLVEDIGHHLIQAGGKRLRPILVLLSAKALNYSEDKHIELAAVIEFIHTATLLHDDVVDVSALRRGLPTANEKWGNAPSVLVGDFLYSRAFQMMVNIGSMEIMHILSNTTNVIAEGEVQQLANARNPNLTEDQYFSVIYKKTAALFEAASMCGASISNASESHTRHLKAYGYHLGLAFQLMDDLLDYDGDSALLGKNVGDDLAEGKATLPIIRTLTKANEQESATISEAITNADATSLSKIIELVHKYDGLSYTKELAKKHAYTAIDHSKALPESEWRQCLVQIAEFAIERAH